MARRYLAMPFRVNPDLYHFDDTLQGAVTVADEFVDTDTIAVVYQMNSEDGCPVAVVIEGARYRLERVIEDDTLILHTGDVRPVRVNAGMPQEDN